MQFQKNSILEMIDKAIAKHRNEFDAHEARRLTDFTKAKAAWENKFGPKWDEAIKIVAAARKKGLPVTREMLPIQDTGYSYNDKIATYSSGEFKPETYKKPIDLLAQKKLIEASTDEKISSSHFKIKDIERLARDSV